MAYTIFLFMLKRGGGYSGESHGVVLGFHGGSQEGLLGPFEAQKYDLWSKSLVC